MVGAQILCLALAPVYFACDYFFYSKLEVRLCILYKNYEISFLSHFLCKDFKSVNSIISCQY